MPNPPPNVIMNYTGMRVNIWGHEQLQTGLGTVSMLCKLMITSFWLVCSLTIQAGSVLSSVSWVLAKPFLLYLALTTLFSRPLSLIRPPLLTKAKSRIFDPFVLFLLIWTPISFHSFTFFLCHFIFCLGFLCPLPFTIYCFLFSLSLYPSLTSPWLHWMNFLAVHSIPGSENILLIPAFEY